MWHDCDACISHPITFVQEELMIVFYVNEYRKGFLYANVVSLKVGLTSLSLSVDLWNIFIWSKDRRIFLDRVWFERQYRTNDYHVLM